MPVIAGNDSGEAISARDKKMVRTSLALPEVGSTHKVYTVTYASE